MANAAVRSFRNRLARSIMAISMNRKPRPRQAKYSVGRTMAPPAARSRLPGQQRHQQHQQRDHRRLRQHGQIDQLADLGLRQDLQPAQHGAQMGQLEHVVIGRAVQRGGLQRERVRRGRPLAAQHGAGLVGDGIVRTLAGRDPAILERDGGQVVVDAGPGGRDIDAGVVRYIERPRVAPGAHGGDPLGAPRLGREHDPDVPGGAVGDHVPRRVRHAGGQQRLPRGGQHAQGIDRELADRDGNRDDATRRQRTQVGGQRFGGEGAAVGLGGIEEVPRQVHQVIGAARPRRGERAVRRQRDARVGGQCLRAAEPVLQRIQHDRLRLQRHDLARTQRKRLGDAESAR